MSKGRPKPSLRDLARECESMQELEGHLDEFLEGSDRAVALVGCAALDSALKLALSVRLIYGGRAGLADLFELDGAPLLSLSVKIRLGRSLGLYGSNFQKALNLVRKIRNGFAHSFIPLSFDDGPIAKLCGELPFIENPKDTHAWVLDSNRKIYTHCCLELRGLLVNVASAMIKRELRLWKERPDLAWRLPDLPGPAPSPRKS